MGGSRGAHQRDQGVGHGARIEVLILRDRLQGGALHPVRHDEAALAVGQDVDVFRHGIQFHLR